MQLHSSLALTMLLAIANAAPWPADVGTNTPRDVSNVNDETSEVTQIPKWALQSVGLSKRSSLVTCQPTTDDGTDGLTESGGDKEWVPVDQWLGAGTEFCNAKYGQFNQVPESQPGISSAYGVSLTNQKVPSAKGDPGHIAFFFINKSAGKTQGISFNDCISGIEHIGAWKGSPWGQSKCWGSKHNDTKGGTWDIGNGFYVGGSISEGSPSTTV